MVRCKLTCFHLAMHMDGDTESNLSLAFSASDKNLDLKISGQIVRDKELIKCYDNCDIIILPSYVEAYPQVILESLSRLKPIIIFNEIQYLKKTFPIFINFFSPGSALVRFAI